MRTLGRREREVKAVRKEFQNVQSSFRSVDQSCLLLWGSHLYAPSYLLPLPPSPCQGDGAGRRVAAGELGLPGPQGCVPVGERGDVKGVIEENFIPWG